MERAVQPDGDHRIRTGTDPPLSRLVELPAALSGEQGLSRSTRLRCIDVGSGAGFPGLPLKIYCPRMHVVLLEATGKKVTFIEHVVERLGLEEATPLKGRAEEVAPAAGPPRAV